MVKNIKDAFGPRGSFLCHGNNSAHGVQPGIEASDVCEEGRKHADGDLSFADLPDAKTPHDQQTDFGKQCHRGTEERPYPVDAVV